MFRTQARELTFKEKTVLVNYKKITQVKTHIENKINVEDLSLGEFLSFKVLKNSCRALDDMTKLIDDKDESFTDQSQTLVPLVSICSQGVVGLTDLLIRQSRL